MDDDFEKKMAGQFNGVEASIGSDAYQANCEATHAVAAQMRAKAKFVEAIAGALIVTVIFGVLAFMPVLWWLWGWAV